MNDGVPVLKEFFKQFPDFNLECRKGSDMHQKLVDDWKYKFNRTNAFQDATPSDETRFSFWLAFGILPDEQLALENGFSPLRTEFISEQIQEEVSLLQFSGA